MTTGDPNTESGTCTRCGSTLAAGEGHFVLDLWGTYGHVLLCADYRACSKRVTGQEHEPGPGRHV